MNKNQAISILVNDLPKYTAEFERLYGLYNNHNYRGNKERAFKIFESKWQDKNIEALEVVINMYLDDMKNKNRSDFKPHFESFLHRHLENYILEKQKEI